VELYRTENSQNFHLRVESEKSALNVVLSWFDDSIGNIIPDRTLWECKLALTEGFTNTVCHAHRDLPKDTLIELNLILTDSYLLMEIWDQGVFFDLEAELKSLRENPPDPLKDEHRRGLIFMKQLTDELEYSRDGQERNCLKMLKKLDFCNSSFNQSSS